MNKIKFVICTYPSTEKCLKRLQNIKIKFYNENPDKVVRESEKTILPTGQQYTFGLGIVYLVNYLVENTKFI